METFIIQSKVLAEQRKSYLNLSKIFKKQQKENENKKLTEKKTHFFGGTQMSHGDLLNVMEYINEKYEEEKPKPDYKNRLGVSCALLTIPVTQHFDDYDGKMYGHINTNVDIEDGVKIKIAQYEKRPAIENCKNTYIMCLNEIMKHKIDIYGIETDLENFHNRNSGCIDYQTFTFYCSKNNYQFKIIFYGDLTPLRFVLLTQSEL